MSFQVEVDGLHKNFYNLDVIKGIDLEVKPHESLVIIGKSGCGKSVFAKLILGLLKPSAGKVMISGVDISSSNVSTRKIMEDVGVVFQLGALFDSMPIWKNITFKLLHNRLVNQKQAIEIAREHLDIVGLDSSIVSLYPNEISGGMQRRVALARTIAYKPKLLVLDEPATGLDPISARLIDDLIININTRLKLTLITITHDIHSALKIADRIAFFHEGRIAWLGNTEDIHLSGNDQLRKFVYDTPVAW